MSTEAEPSDVHEGGRRLWSDVTDRFELDEHESTLLLQASRTVDLLDELAAAIERDGAILDGATGRIPP